MLNTATLASLIFTAFTTLVTFPVNAAQDPLELGGRVQSPTLQLRLVQSQLQSLTESGQEKSKLHEPFIAMRAQSQVLAAISKIFPMKKEADEESQETETTEQNVDEKAEDTGAGVSPSRSGKGMSKEQIRKEIARLQAMARTAG